MVEQNRILESTGTGSERELDWGTKEEEQGNWN